MIWIGVILLCVGLLVVFITSDEHSEVCFLGTSLACIGMALILISHYETKPSAIDVYQGKTTLEYTIVDGVKVDSIVVFKDNYDEK